MSTHKPTILVGDDHADIRRMMQMAAQMRGWDCDVAETAQEIVDKVQARCTEGANCYDALILDVNYEGGPRITGIQAVRAIRRKYPNIPVIFITGYSSKLVRDEAMKVGQEYVVKPFDPDYVLDRAHVWMCWAGMLMDGYTGPERRVRSINRSGLYRRATDRPITINTKVAEAATEATGHHGG
jgi:DNA-binding response OmpR family regulator